MSGSCPRLCLGPRLDMIICWRNLSPAFVVGTGRILWSPVPRQPLSFLESNGATLETCLREIRTHEHCLVSTSLFCRRCEGHTQGAMLSESISAERMSLRLPSLSWFLRCFLGRLGLWVPSAYTPFLQASAEVSVSSYLPSQQA